MKREFFRLAVTVLTSWRSLRNILFVTIISAAFSVLVGNLILPLFVDFDLVGPQKARSAIMITTVLSGGIPLFATPVTVLVFEVAMQQLKQSQAALVEMAQSDFLTGLLNRHGFYEKGGELVRTARTRRQPVAMMILDIDHFKKVNDRFGHGGGDAAIRHIATLISRFSEAGIAARIGGEEFAVLLPGVPIREALAIAENIRAACEWSSLDYDGSRIAMTISVGTAVDAHDEIELENLLKRADLALYRAKDSGRNQIASAA